MFHLNRVYCRQSEVPRSLRDSSISEDSIGERFSQQPLAQQILVGLLAQHVARRILVQRDAILGSAAQTPAGPSS